MPKNCISICGGLPVDMKKHMLYRIIQWHSSDLSWEQDKVSNNPPTNTG